LKFLRFWDWVVTTPKNGKRKHPFFSEFFVGPNTMMAKFHCNILGLTAKSPSFLHLDILVFQKNLGGHHFGLNFYFR